jgi:integrase
MSVRKRTWTTSEGERKEAWIVDYVDQHGERHIETFAKKKDADAYHATVKVDVRKGVHTAASKSITVTQAAENWLKYIELEGREPATILGYRIHVNRHIVPRMGRDKLANLTTPHINKFRDDLLGSAASRSLAKAVLKSFKAILKDAHRRGDVAQNVARDVIIGTSGRGKRKLKVGVDIPTPDEIRKIIHAATGKRRPLLLTAVFAGLRGSELRGLRWQDVDLNRGELHVRQRADRYNVMGKPKSQSGDRTIPLGPLVLNALKEGGLLVLRERVIWCFRMGREIPKATPTWSGGLGSRCRSRRVSSTTRAKPDIPAYTPHAIFMCLGASTGSRTVGWNCLSRRCSLGSVMPASCSPAMSTATCSRARTTAVSWPKPKNS